MTSLRSRTLLALSGVALALVAITAALVLTVVRQSFGALERQTVQRDVERALAGIDRHREELQALASDYAASQPMLLALARGEETGAAARTAAGKMTRTDVDVVAVFNVQGALRLAQGRPGTREERTRLPDELLSQLPPPCQGRDQSPATDCPPVFVVTPDAVHAAAWSRIMDESGQTAGWLVLARRIDGLRLVQASERIQAQVQLFHPDQEDLPADVASAQEVLARDRVHYSPLSSDRIAGYARVTPVRGSETLILRSTSDRNVYRHGFALLVGLVGCVAIAGAVVVGAGTFLVNRWVVARVERLNREVGAIAASRDMARRVVPPGPDEVGVLAAAVNNLLAAQERTMGELASEIRERMRAQERLARLNRELEATLQFRQDLSNMLVHDIRSPLTVIDFYLQLQSRRQSGNTPDASLQLASKSVNRLNHMINDLLIMAKFEAGKVVLNRSTFDLRQLILRNIDEVRFLAEKRGVAIVDDFPVHACTVDLDASLLWRVVENLLSNAVKYSPEAAQVVVKLERVPFSQYNENRPEELMLSVFDEGPGIPPEYHEAIFEKFNVGKVDRSKLQIGLGLSFCRMIVEAQQGRIWVEDNVPRGSVFRVVLPLAGARRPAVASEATG